MRESIYLVWAGLLGLTLLAAAPAAARGPSGNFSKTMSNSRGQSATLEGRRDTQGNQAQSSWQASGPRGKSVQGSSSSQVQGNSASGQATVTGPGGKSVTGSGNATATKSGVKASGTASGPGGKSASGAMSGNKTAGSATVSTDKGDANATWNQDSVSVSGPQGKSGTLQRRTR